MPYLGLVNDANGQREAGRTVARLQRLARSLQKSVSSDLAADFLNATSALPWIQPRRLYQDPETKELFPGSAIASIPAERRWKLTSRSFGEHEYYEGRYGMSLAYATVVDALAERGLASLSGKRVLDIGYGSILPLRLMACMGAKVIGLETDRFPGTLYSHESDTGAVRAVRGRTIDRTRDGSIELRRGRFGVDWTPDPASLDLIISRNTLKNGYIHPRAEHAHEPNVRLGLSDERFLQAARASLVSGGLLAIYNTFDPRDPGPGADGRSPFTTLQFEGAGFRTVALDEPDDERSRRLYEAAQSAGADAGGPIGAAPVRALLTLVRTA